MKKENRKYVWGVAIMAVLVLLAWLVPVPQSWKRLMAFLGIVAAAYLCLTPYDSLFSIKKLKAESRAMRIIDIEICIFALVALAAACYFMFFSPLDSKQNIRYTLGDLLLTIAVLITTSYITSKKKLRN